MIFSIICCWRRRHAAPELTEAPVLLGFNVRGAVIFWFSGASMQR